MVTCSHCKNDDDEPKIPGASNTSSPPRIDKSSLKKNLGNRLRRITEKLRIVLLLTKHLS